MKEFKSITEQIQILRDRGLTIENQEKAELYLLTNNYYNIINGYGKFFCS
ncbi:TPA: Abi family protein, partial [Streptococcus pyogenes]